MTKITELTKDETVEVEYESAHSDDTQTVSGKVLEAGETWNGEQWEVELKNTDGVYRVRESKEDGGALLERLQYDWQDGERVSLTNTQRVSERNGDVLTITTKE